jgi:aspartokinase/homoserine dehydrogenase 1
MVKVGIIGVGNIGSELYNRIRAKEWDISCVIDVDGVYNDVSKEKKLGMNYLEHIKGLNLLFLAIPTFDDGKTAFNYISSSLEERVPVVTCEKGALSNYFSELEQAVKDERIGYSATVGGGSRLLRFLHERVGPQVEEIHAVVNGTLNYIFDQVSRGRSLGEVVRETQTLGYAEPGAAHPLEVINKEAIGDVPMKTSILFNICNLTKQRIRAKDMKTYQINDSELKRLVKEAVNRRYIVSITKDVNNEEDVIGGFKHKVDDWYVSVGFKHIEENPLFRELIPSGVNNSVILSEGKFGKDGSYKLSGPGAGSGPTTNSMVIDAEKILNIKYK